MQCLLCQVQQTPLLHSPTNATAMSDTAPQYPRACTCARTTAGTAGAGGESVPAPQLAPGCGVGGFATAGDFDASAGTSGRCEGTFLPRVEHFLLLARCARRCFLPLLARRCFLEGLAAFVVGLTGLPTWTGSGVVGNMSFGARFAACSIDAINAALIMASRAWVLRLAARRLRLRRAGAGAVGASSGDEASRGRFRLAGSSASRTNFGVATSAFNPVASRRAMERRRDITRGRSVVCTRAGFMWGGVHGESVMASLRLRTPPPFTGDAIVSTSSWSKGRHRGTQ